MPSITELLTEPDVFFRKRSERPSVKWALLIVALVALFGVFSVGVQHGTLVELGENINASEFANASENQSADDTEEIAEVFADVFIVALFVFALITPFIAWLLYTVAFHLISVVFEGEGGFTRTLALVGWGFVPVLIEAVIDLAIDYYQFQIVGVDVPEEVTLGTIQEISQQSQQTELMILSGILGVLATLWSGYLWVYAVKHARNLTRRQATLTVAVPVLISLLLSIRALLGAL